MSHVLSEHLFLLTCSSTEPFGLVFLEALLTSTFIVTPRCGGGLEIFSRVPACFRSFFIFVDPGDNIPVKISQHFDSIVLDSLSPSAAELSQLISLFSPSAHALSLSKILTQIL